MTAETGQLSAGCLICGEELGYQESSAPAACVLCERIEHTNVQCVQGHFVCDECHALPAYDLIERTCLHGEQHDPLELARQLMHTPALKMHGPEHHFLVPAVLVSCASRAAGRTAALAEKLAEVRRRAEHVRGGFCGTHGACGAAIGAGIFASVMTGATPLSRDEWRLSNRLTSQALLSIANHGGPRCCKRCTTLAILEAIDFAAGQLWLRIPSERHTVCPFSAQNQQCLEQSCPFFGREEDETQAQ